MLGRASAIRLCLSSRRSVSRATSTPSAFNASVNVSCSVWKAFQYTGSLNR